jgi:rRNA maturation RNase YbeY
LGCHEKELSVLLTDDEQIAELNAHYLNKSGPTNVLAFPMEEGPDPELESPMLGDVVISTDTALRESEEAGESLEEAVDRLLIHGVLHLLGYDHEKSVGEAQRMQKEERRLLTLVKEI